MRHGHSLAFFSRSSNAANNSPYLPAASLNTTKQIKAIKWFIALLYGSLFEKKTSLACWQLFSLPSGLLFKQWRVSARWKVFFTRAPETSNSVQYCTVCTPVYVKAVGRSDWSFSSVGIRLFYWSLFEFVFVFRFITANVTEKKIIQK